VLFTRSGVMHLASSHPSIHEPDRLACLLPLPALGPTSPDLNLAALPASLHLGVHAKTRFSMVVPPVERILEQRPEIRNIILVGIEVCCTIIKLNLPSVLTPPEVAHLCSSNGGAPLILPVPSVSLNPPPCSSISGPETMPFMSWPTESLHAISASFRPCCLLLIIHSPSRHEIPIALATMRQAGAIVTTSESVLFQLFGDAGRPDFKAFASAIKEEASTNKQTLQSML